MKRIRKGQKKKEKKKRFLEVFCELCFFFSILCFFVFGSKREKGGGEAGRLGVGYRYLFLCFCLRGYEKRSTGSLLHAFTSLVWQLLSQMCVDMNSPLSSLQRHCLKL